MNKKGNLIVKTIQSTYKNVYVYSRTQRISVYYGRGYIFDPGFSNVMSKYLKYYLNLECFFFQNPYHQNVGHTHS
jgi:hypothetical protein